MNETLVSRTFVVADVSVATEPLPEVPYPQAIARFLCGPVESCSRYHGHLVANVFSHPLIAALHAGFETHRPIILSPDIIWLTITQGLAKHINLNSEALRRRFVTHDHSLTIKVRRDDFIKGSHENPWPEVFSEFSEQIRDHIGDSHNLIVASFSTTGATERAASEIVLLESMQFYFDYEVHTLCGIPAVTMLGTVADWEAIASRVERFSDFGMDWWVDSLRPLLNQFVDAAAGRIDQEFWNSIYKYQGSAGSGSPMVSGWVSSLFPYLQDHTKQSRRNPWLDDQPSHHGPSRDEFPNSVSVAPFKWIIGRSPNCTTYEMQFIGGLIGVNQCPDSLALRPEIGWAIQEAAAAKWSGEGDRVGIDTDPSSHSVTLPPRQARW